MAKPISNTIFAVIAIGILLFIGHSIYDVLTRAPVKGSASNQAPGSTASHGVTGQIELPASNTDTMQPPPPGPLPVEPATTAQDSPSDSGSDQPSPASQANPAENTATENTTQAETLPESGTENETSALQTNPQLKLAIPPVPQAPPSPFPPVTPPVSEQELFDATANHENSDEFDESANPISNFPAPISSFPAPNTTTPSGSSSNFPASNSFPAPSNSGNINSIPNAEQQRLEELRQQKEQLRRDLGF